MSLRFRLGSVTFGRSGPRISVWTPLGGGSVPLTGSDKKSRSFGKVSAGPFSWFFGGSQKYNDQTELNMEYPGEPYELEAIKAFASDQQLLGKLQRYGIPWRGIQERLKGALPDDLPDRDNVAYKLVPKALEAVLGQQGTAWISEKRPSKSGKGSTTWIVLI